MKETETKSKEPIEVIQEQKTELKLVGRIFPHRGHTLFEFNRATGAMVPATFESEDILIDLTGKKQPAPRRRLIVVEHCIYISALNKRNAFKKIGQGSNGSRL